MGNNSKPDNWIVSETPATVMIESLTSIHCGDREDAGIADDSSSAVIVLDPLPEIGLKATPVAGAHSPLIACLARGSEDKNEVETFPICILVQLPCEPSGKQPVMRAIMSSAEVPTASDGPAVQQSLAQRQGAY